MSIKDFDKYCQEMNESFSPLTEREYNIARTFWIRAEDEMIKRVEIYHTELIGQVDRLLSNLKRGM